MNENIKSKMDEYLNAWLKLKKFIGSVLIAKEGAAIFSEAYGMANYEHDVPNTLQTKFHIGSMTKQFTAMAIMQLQEKKMVDVNDPVAKYISGYSAGEKITIHNLLTHTAGVPNHPAFPEFAEVETYFLEEIVEMIKRKPLEFEAGEKFSYSNTGYTLLAYIIEKLSRISYEEFLKKNIFESLGMKSSGYSYSRPIIKNRANGYSLKKGEFVNAQYSVISNVIGAGGLYSTVEDLYLWDRALYTEKLVSRESLDKIFAPFKANNAYGWIIAELFGRKYVFHNGGWYDGHSIISRFVDDDVCIIVLSNLEVLQSPVEDIAVDLAAIMFDEKYELPKERVPIKVDSKVYDTYVGEYEVEHPDAPPDFIITITKEGNRIFAQTKEQNKLEIYPLSEIKFFYKEVEAQITFVKDELGKVAKLILHQFGHDMPADRFS